ncbi:AAA family ATPase [Aliarcobacter cryaerophilus]|jgi:MinD-like ATPase involved in chromosome partitioning or flagellar assembly|uniref:ParA family protein n=1 Tax=Aliarcobacter cryaerophilus TaxID=28198 RepID=UPI0021B5F92E|nr:AAA family ATPase [Aliarcobacter cryaerophilus]MCT7488765.1 AAA family ATPase [Aliarcobacter cryaerophilus]
MKSILFYSFKGGVGRTQTLLNVAKYLANDLGKKILIVDFDIYAPGVSYHLDLGKKEDEDYLIGGLLKIFKGVGPKFYCELLTENVYVIPSANIKNLELYHNDLTELSQYLYSIKKSSDDREKCDGISLGDDLYRYIIKSIDKLDLSFDYVFFDSRTGITEVSDILFSNLLDLKVIVSSYNTQNIHGTDSILRMISKQLGKKHEIIRVLSPKPKSFEENIYKDISVKANLEKEEFRSKFEWHGLYEIPYEETIVANDNNAWDNLDKDCLYKKHIMSLSTKIVQIFDKDTELKEIFEMLDNE